MTERDRRAPIQLGALYSTTGVMAGKERLLLSAAQFAVDEINQAGGIDGREVKIIHYDPGSDPIYYRHLAEELITKHQIKLIFGCYMSSARMAVKPVVEQHNGLLFYPAQYEGFEYSKNIIYSGAVANQNCAHLAAYLARHAPPRMFIVGSAYIWPRESARTMTELISSRGGTVIGQAFFKLDAVREEFSRVIAKIKNLSPDVIFCNLVGPSASLFYQAYAAARLDAEKMPIASLTTSETHIRDMGAEFAVGHVTAAPYFQSVQSQVNQVTLERFGKWLDAPFVTNMGWEAGYCQFRMVARAIAEIGSMDVELLRNVLLGATYDAPQGRIQLDAETNHTYLWPRIGRANEAGQFDILEESIMCVKPDPYLTSHRQVAWDLAHAT